MLSIFILDAPSIELGFSIFHFPPTIEFYYSTYIHYSTGLCYGPACQYLTLSLLQGMCIRISETSLISNQTQPRLRWMEVLIHTTSHGSSSSTQLKNNIYSHLMFWQTQIGYFGGLPLNHNELIIQRRDVDINAKQLWKGRQCQNFFHTHFFVACAFGNVSLEEIVLSVTCYMIRYRVLV